ncbi:cupin domain-containing protein [Oscillatoria sp. FACHB-1406]|uniref:cupin domain-containing protein n=1 Tax=Oscillatoria sp. FACHB-1406 TaxID=2692846 RepID=UPI001685EEA3|nr:cupin domain-containing protein [Oscillatoria sp. FACHB-1406]MBD2577398.1 cupin domain-containing protein [Oscillatoria sp. FACHB-1406]
MIDESPQELAALAALDLLTEEERRLLEDNLREFPELETELAAYSDAAAALAYSAPDAAPSLDLKDRLFSTRITRPPEILHSYEVQWQPHPFPGISLGILHLDRDKGEVTALVRLEPKIEYPLHQHAGVEELFVLEGDVIAAGRVCNPGDYIRSFPGSAHAPVTEGGCLLLVRACLDDEIFAIGT